MKLPFQVNLAISLHAPNNEIRNKLEEYEKNNGNFDVV